MSKGQLYNPKYYQKRKASGYYVVNAKRIKAVADANPHLRHGRFRRWLQRKYGISVTDYDTMLIRCSGLCEICSSQLRKPHVDHCHATGVVRGLLCHRCNIQLAALERDGYATAAMAYLNKYASFSIGGTGQRVPVTDTTDSE